MDAGNFRLQLFDAEGKFLAMAGRYGVGPGELFSPTRIACDAEGNFFVADYNRIQVFDSNLKYLTEIRNESAARLDKFVGVAVEGVGRILTSDAEHCLIERFELTR